MSQATGSHKTYSTLNKLYDLSSQIFLQQVNIFNQSSGSNFLQENSYNSQVKNQSEGWIKAVQRSDLFKKQPPLYFIRGHSLKLEIIEIPFPQSNV